MFKHTFTYLMNPSIITKNDYEVTRMSSGNFIIIDTTEDNKVYFVGKEVDEAHVMDKLMSQGIYLGHWSEIEQAIKVLREQ